jgi:hypothetical protein
MDRLLDTVARNPGSNGLSSIFAGIRDLLRTAEGHGWIVYSGKPQGWRLTSAGFHMWMFHKDGSDCEGHPCGKQADERRGKLPCARELTIDECNQCNVSRHGVHEPRCKDPRNTLSSAYVRHY